MLFITYFIKSTSWQIVLMLDIIMSQDMQIICLHTTRMIYQKYDSFTLFWSPNFHTIVIIMPYLSHSVYIIVLYVKLEINSILFYSNNV